MIIPKRTLTANSPEVKIYEWFYRESAKRYTNYCPFFWLTFLALVASPFRLVADLIGWVINTLGSKLDSIVLPKRQANQLREFENFLSKTTLDELNDYELRNYLYYSKVCTYAYDHANIRGLSVVHILKYKADRMGIPLFKEGVPEDIENGDVYLLSELKEWLSPEYLAYAEGELIKKREAAAIQHENYLKDKAKSDAFDAKVNKIYKTLFGWIPTINKTDLIIWTKRITGWVLVLAAAALVVGIVYGIYSIVPWVSSHLGELVRIFGSLLILILIVACLWWVLLAITSWLNETTYVKRVGIPNSVHKVGGFVLGICRFIAGIGKFLYSGAMMWKADNCPPIEWEDEA
jgi:hypothetical protein